MKTNVVLNSIKLLPEIDEFSEIKKTDVNYPETSQLKTDIDQTLDKFNSAYRMPEVQGSKLKDMLYGTFDLE